MLKEFHYRRVPAGQGVAAGGGKRRAGIGQSTERCRLTSAARKNDRGLRIFGTNRRIRQKTCGGLVISSRLRQREFIRIGKDEVELTALDAKFELPIVKDSPRPERT